MPVDKNVQHLCPISSLKEHYTTLCTGNLCALYRFGHFSPADTSYPQAVVAKALRAEILKILSHARITTKKDSTVFFAANASL